VKRAAILLALLVSCTESRDRDREALTKIVDIDMRASQAMRDADEAATKGDAGAAVAIIDRRATPAVDEALATLEHTTVSSEWGRAKKSALDGIVHDRKKEMPRYTDAVKSGDLEKMVGAMQAQAEIERRALGTVAELSSGR
jgi:hypothetical protein